MTDVIRGEQKSVGVSCILSANYVNARDTAKHESHQQLASVIHARFHLPLGVCRGFVAIEKLFFPAD